MAGRHRAPRRRPRTSTLVLGGLLAVLPGMLGTAQALPTEPVPATPAVETVLPTVEPVIVPADIDLELASIEVSAVKPPPPPKTTPTPISHIIWELEEELRRQEADRWVHPLVGSYALTSGYGPRGAIPEAGVGAMFHNGIDLAAPAGTELVAAHAGTVTYSDWGHPERGNTGWVVEVTHADGTQTMYNHMNAQSPVPVGTAVRAGDVIGEVGSTGNSSGPHLHLSVWVDGQHVDPLEFFAEKGIFF